MSRDQLVAYYRALGFHVGGSTGNQLSYPPPAKPEMLTSEEIADLRAQAERNSEYFKKAFAHLRPNE